MSLFPHLSLSVVIPAYNEESLIDAAIRRSIPALTRVVDTFEIVLIDDCSTDATPRLVDELAAEFPEVHAIHNSVNLRQGGSLRLGFARARYDLVMHNAVDCPFEFDDLPTLLRHFPAADVVVAKRRSYPGVRAGRELMSTANRTLIRTLFGVNVTDYNFIQVYKRAVLERQACISDATLFLTVERIVRAHHAGLRVVEVETEYHPRRAGTSTSGTLRNIVASLRDMARLRLELSFGRSAAQPTKSGGSP
jgi:glycosyltransferase involved in cell wall biosynthesis